MDILSLILGLLKFVNWLTRQMDEARLRADGRRELILEQMTELNTRLGRVDTIITEGDKLTPEERKKIALED